MLAVLLVFVLSGCGEDAYGPPRKLVNTAQTQKDFIPAKPSEPVLLVGDVTMPMPAPDGFKRIPNDSELVRAIQGNVPTDEVLLCLFERSGEVAANTDLSVEGLLLRDTLTVSTLNKWLDVEIASLDFLKLKQPWQEDSIEFNQGALVNFEEAVKTRLAAQSEFSYNLGMIDSSPLHISFLKVMKHTGSNNRTIYTCSTTSLLWRYGKIIRLSYSRRIDGFSQIQSVVAESVGYIQKLQTLHRTTRVQSETAN